MSSEFLGQAFWDSRWNSGQTGWDLGMVSPPLRNYMDAVSDSGKAILIPGCGNAWEAEYLLELGFQDITLIDISPKAAELLQSRFGQSRAVKIVCGDFFHHQGKYDLILEQTFFCALMPSLRTQYVLKMRELLKEGGILAGLLFDVKFGFDGPPFGGSAEEYKTLFSPYFQIKTWEKSLLSHPQRMGNELFVELTPIKSNL